MWLVCSRHVVGMRSAYGRYVVGMLSVCGRFVGGKSDQRVHYYRIFSCVYDLHVIIFFTAPRSWTGAGDLTLRNVSRFLV